MVVWAGFKSKLYRRFTSPSASSSSPSCRRPRPFCGFDLPVPSLADVEELGLSREQMSSCQPRNWPTPTSETGRWWISAVNALHDMGGGGAASSPSNASGQRPNLRSDNGPSVEPTTCRHREKLKRRDDVRGIFRGSIMSLGQEASLPVCLGSTVSESPGICTSHIIKMQIFMARGGGKNC